MLSPPRRAYIYRLALSSDENFSPSSLCLLNIAQDPVVGWAATEPNHYQMQTTCDRNETLHDRTHEVSEVLDSPNFDLRDLSQELIFESTVPDRRRNIQPGKRGALLSCNATKSFGLKSR